MVNLLRNFIRRSRNQAFAAITLAALLLVVGFAAGHAGSIEPINGGPVSADRTIVPEADYFRGPLKVMTLNIAHGRKTAFSQIFLSWQTIHQNLAEISKVFKTTGADIVALQEADGPSWWSGDFNHVALLAQKAGYPWHALAPYMDRWGLQYGAALLARRPYLETRAYRFGDLWPTPVKGFLLARFGWYPEGVAAGNPVFVDVVSVHLDFSRESIRNEQIAEMRRALTGRKNPLIIMGDFNSDWLADDSVVRNLSRASGLQIYRPEAPDLATYNSKRIDWILISEDLTFISYNVLPDAVSDHRGVVAEIRVAQ